MENLGYTILILVITALAIAGFVLRKRLWIIFIRTLHGKYSFRYLSSLPKNYLDMNHPPAIRYDPLYVIEGFLNNVDASTYNTSINIDFQGYVIGKSYPDFFKIAGNPYYLSISENKKDIVNFVVVGYKQQIYSYEAVMLYFFWNNVLVAGQYQIRREKQNVNPSDLIAKLMDKYSIKEGNLDAENFKVQDANNNEIYFEDTGFALEISTYNITLIQKLKSPGMKINEPDNINVKAATATF